MNSISRIFGQLFSEISRLADLESKSLHGQRRIKRRLANQSQFQFENLESRTMFAANFGYATGLQPLNNVGGTLGIDSHAIVADDAGNTYVTGNFKGSYFPGIHVVTSNGLNDVFVTKLDPAGAVVWVRGIGGTGEDFGRGITLEANGNLLVAGSFTGTVDFDPGAGTTNLVSLGLTDGFVLRLDDDGNFLTAVRLGGALSDGIEAIAVDPANAEIAITGSFQGTVNPGNGIPNVTSIGASDAFVSILSSGALASQTFSAFGGTQSDEGRGIVIAPGRDVYVTGTFAGTADFDPSAGTLNLVSAGNADAFVARLNGETLVWATRTGSAVNDSPFGIALDPDGNVLTVGEFRQTADFNGGTGTFNLTSAGPSDGYVLMQDNLGGFVFARQIGGPEDDSVQGIAIDDAGFTHITGNYRKTARFGAGTSAPQLTAVNVVGQSRPDSFVARMSKVGTFMTARSLGGPNSLEFGRAIAVNNTGSIFSTGIFNQDADFDPGVANRSLIIGVPGVFSAYVSHLTPDLNFKAGADAALQMRRNGTALEIRNVFDPANPVILASSVLNETRSVNFSAGTGNSTLAIDFRSGGTFTLPEGMQLAGTAGQLDVTMIGLGTEAFTARPSSIFSRRGTLEAHGQEIEFIDLNSISLVRSLSVLVETEGASQALNLAPSIFNGTERLSQISGTSFGTSTVTITPIRFNVPNLTINTAGVNSTNSQTDSISMAANALEGSGVQNLTIRTSPGNDTLTVNGPAIGLPVAGGAFSYIGGNGVDRLVVSGNTDWRLNDARVISGASGRILIDDVERATMHGGSGANLLTAVGFSGSVILNGDSGADILRGGEGNDTLLAGDGNDWLFGNDGNDTLDGQGNNDWLFGGDGNDSLLGGLGNDILSGQLGNDTLDGQAGIDLYQFEGTNNAESLRLQFLTATTSQFVRKPRGLTTTLELDSLTNDATDEVSVQGLAGDDLITIDLAITMLGVVDGGDGTDSCTAPASWTKISC
ncbi:MAG: calcium-binding protein [Pirellulaceae bacterium]